MNNAHLTGDATEASLPKTDCCDSVTNGGTLRLRGGGESQGDIVLSECCASLIDKDDSLSEEDIRDMLLEAGYTVEAIRDIMAEKSNARNFCNTLLTTESLRESNSDASGSESEGESALNVLKEIRIKNLNNIIIGTLNINSLALKFEQLRV